MNGFVSLEFSFQICVLEVWGCLGDIAAYLSNTSCLQEPRKGDLAIYKHYKPYADLCKHYKP